WTNGLASEAALKLREAAQAWAEAYPAMEYRHGPISLGDPDTAVIAIGPIDATLGTDIRATGATLVDPDPSPWPRWCSRSGWLSGSRRCAASIPTCPVT